MIPCKASCFRQAISVPCKGVPAHHRAAGQLGQGIVLPGAVQCAILSARSFASRPRVDKVGHLWQSGDGVLSLSLMIMTERRQRHGEAAT